MVALCGARGGDLRSATFPRLAPPRPQVPEVRLGPIFERFLERCPLDSELSCDNIWVSKCMLFLRSRYSAGGWLSLYPPSTMIHGPYRSSRGRHSRCGPSPVGHTGHFPGPVGSRMTGSARAAWQRPWWWCVLPQAAHVQQRSHNTGWVLGATRSGPGSVVPRRDQGAGAGCWEACSGG